MAATVPDRNKGPKSKKTAKRKVDMNKPCPSCGMIHADPNFDYEKHATQTKAVQQIGKALFGNLD
jgi:hypothetical protein